MNAPEQLPDWERLLSAERHIQALVPGAVLVGGTAAALHAHHRRSLDGDHVLGDLRARFPEMLGELEAAAGWHTARVLPPVLIPGDTSTLAEVAQRLAEGAPTDLGRVDLASDKSLVAPWNDLSHLISFGRAWAARLAGLSLEQT